MVKTERASELELSGVEVADVEDLVVVSDDGDACDVEFKVEGIPFIGRIIRPWVMSPVVGEAELYEMAEIIDIREL